MTFLSHAGDAAGGTLAPLQSVSGSAPRPGRRRQHSNSAARVAAYRAAHARLDFTTSPRIAATIASLAEDLDASRNEVLQSLVRFALTNRNWRQQGLWGGKGAPQ